MTVSAVARLMPRPPDLVDNRKQNCSAPGAGLYKGSNKHWYIFWVSPLSFLGVSDVILKFYSIFLMKFL